MTSEDALVSSAAKKAKRTEGESKKETFHKKGMKGFHKKGMKGFHKKGMKGFYKKGLKGFHKKGMKGGPGLRESKGKAGEGGKDEVPSESHDP